MGETTRQIASHIAHTREDLDMNLHELEHKVKSATDWRYQFRHNPMLMAGLAFSGGVLLATITGGKRNPLAGMSSKESNPPAGAPVAGAAREKQQVVETWEHIKAALVGVAASRLKTFLGESIPGFEEQLTRTEREAASAARERQSSMAASGVAT